MSRLEIIIVLAASAIGLALSVADLSDSMAMRMLRGECAGIGRSADCIPRAPPAPPQPGGAVRPASANATHDAQPIPTSTQITGA
jgi:hypothetical protein